VPKSEPPPNSFLLGSALSRLSAKIAPLVRAEIVGALIAELQRYFNDQLLPDLQKRVEAIFDRELPGRLDAIIDRELPGRLDAIIDRELPGRVDAIIDRELPGRMATMLGRVLPRPELPNAKKNSGGPFHASLSGKFVGRQRDCIRMGIKKRLDFCRCRYISLGNNEGENSLRVDQRHSVWRFQLDRSLLKQNSRHLLPRIRYCAFFNPQE
jgi:hypothetical protein